MENRLLRNQNTNGVSKRLKRPSDHKVLKQKNQNQQIQPNFQEFALNLSSDKKPQKNIALIIKDLMMSRRNLDCNLKNLSEETKNKIIKKILYR